MGMTIDKAIEHGKEQLEIFGGEHNEFIQTAVETMRKYQKIINDYETLADSLEKSGASPKVCTKKIDKFCIDTMKGILCDYYADTLHEVVKDGKID